MREDTAAEEVVVVNSGTEEAAACGSGGAVRWERFLPRMIVRVLLVESDDSTRQIIAALLRKCSYTVTAAADGLKAWEMLKEKPQNIDLILTEMELPSVSGFNLLTMIMEHEICKNIPVIMMSPRVSIDIVFKCMLKGATDFLVKPVRKNELSNLWLHVWRRQFSNGGPGGIHGHRHENRAQEKLEGNSENNAASNHSSDFLACVHKNGKCSEKASDTQSSCTRPDMEAESAYMQNMQEHKRPNSSSSSSINHMRVQGGEGCEKMDEDLLMDGSEAEYKSSRVDPVVAPHCQAIDSSNHILGKECVVFGGMAQENVMSMGCMKVTNITYGTDEPNFDQAKPSREVDLIGALDNQLHCIDGLKINTDVQDDVSSDAEILVDIKDHECRPLLELSLRRYQLAKRDKQENDVYKMLNHSSSSAFSRYNSGRVLSPVSPFQSLRTESNNYISLSHRPLPNQGLCHGNISQCNTVPLKIDPEDVNSSTVGLPNQGEMAVQCSHLGVVPFPVSIGGLTCDDLRAGYSLPKQPIFYTQSGPVWTTHSTANETIHGNVSLQPDPETLNSEQNHHSHDQNARKQMYQAEKEQTHNNMESSEERRHVSSITDVSGSSGIYNGSRSHLNSNGCGSASNGSNGNLAATNIVRATAESANDNGLFTHEEIKLVDFQRPTQRQAALNKFRLKRKDRCFEKKVRYQSRKRLAEQRPRVRGQFVRQVRPDPQPCKQIGYPTIHSCSSDTVVPTKKLMI